jgi:hypothetical protein
LKAEFNSSVANDLLKEKRVFITLWQLEQPRLIRQRSPMDVLEWKSASIIPIDDQHPLYPLTWITKPLLAERSMNMPFDRLADL